MEGVELIGVAIRVWRARSICLSVSLLAAFAVSAQTTHSYDVLDRVRTINRAATSETINIDPSGNITSLQLTLSSSVVNGQCGPASGQSIATAPVAFLCTAGRPSALAGSGPWTWTCAGSNGGTNAATCNAAPSTCTFNFTGTGSVTNVSTASRDDALVFTRWLFGLRGTALVDGITPYPAGTSVAQFAANVSARLTIGPMHDIDNNGKIEPLTDGLLLLRMTLGISGPALTAGALGTGATRVDYGAIRTYLNSNCGGAF